MYSVLLFIFGLAIGSFLNVLALRYDGEHFVLDPKVIGGRSHCPHCKTTLQWFELFPVFSFLFLRGRCRHCRARIGWQYPAVELLSGLIFALVPWRLAYFYPALGGGFIAMAAFWIIAFEILLLASYIDLRLQIIPDELNIALFVAAIAAASAALSFGSVMHSFLGAYGLFFGLQSNFWVSHAIGALVAGAFFEALVLGTRGRGMGMGDVKLALPLGFLFGWPDIMFVCAAAFIAGAIIGLILIARGTKTMKAALPFVPFLFIGSCFVLFFQIGAIDWYLRLIGL